MYLDQFLKSLEGQAAGGHGCSRCSQFFAEIHSISTSYLVRIISHGGIAESEVKVRNSPQVVHLIQLHRTSKTLICTEQPQYLRRAPCALQMEQTKL